MDNIVSTSRDVNDASLRLKDWILQTPVLESVLLNERVGARVLVKAECLQHAGRFKIRGALNRMLRLNHSERGAGVVTFSSGNHGQAVALAAKWLGVSATVVMPEDAPNIKKHNARRFGAEVVLYNRYQQDREQIATELANERGAALVPPFDHSDVVAGQGTVGLELAAVAKAQGLELSAVYIPCSGGGLAAGSALALKSAFPECAIFAVEPEGYDDTARSLESGARQMILGQRDTLCDALMAPTPGAISFAINRRLLSGACVVSDEEVLRAMALAATEFRLIVEPSGAAALAAALQQPPSSGECVGVVLSGGNVDPGTWVQAIGRYQDI